MRQKNRKAIKCQCCKKAYSQVKVDQKFCSSACRQKAYRMRKNGDTPRAKRGERPMHLLWCEHCEGSFLSSAHNAKFCSTSCRTMSYRASKKAIAVPLAGSIFESLGLAFQVDTGGIPGAGQGALIEMVQA